MKRRLLSLILVFAFAVALAACGGAKEKLDFKEQTVIDNSSCKVVVKKLDPKNFFGYTVKFYLENKTDKALNFSFDYNAANGVTVSALFVKEVAPKSNSTEDLQFSTSDLEKSGLKKITDLEFKMRVYPDGENSIENAVAVETYHIYPYGEAEKGTAFKRANVDSDKVLIDNDKVKFVVTGVADDTLFGKTIKVYIENKTANSMMVDTDNETINGKVIDPLWACEVPANMATFSTINWIGANKLENNGITEINDVSWKFSAYNSDDILAPKYVEEEQSFKFN